MLTQFLNIDSFQLENLVGTQANRLFIMLKLLGVDIQLVEDEIGLTKIDAQFLYTICKLIDFIENIKNSEPSEKSIQQQKELGISDKMLASGIFR